MVVIVALTVLGTGIFVSVRPWQLAASATSTPVWFSYDRAHQVEYWEERIRALGANVAYSKLISEVPDTVSEHEKAHVFGGALYAVAGLSGIGTCDYHFLYGCFHEIISKAIAEQGLAGISQVENECRKTGGLAGCQHGIGHTLVYYHGYTLEGLTKSLSDCDTSMRPHPYEGCYAGVFMEFSMRRMLGDGGQIRPVVHNDYVYPCADLDSKYQAACMYHQVRWWHSIISPSPDRITQLGELCSGLPFGDRVRLACFGGLGVVVVDLADHDKTATLAALCDSAGGGAAERLACRSIAAGFLFANMHHETDEALGACQGLQGSAQNYCVNYATDRMQFFDPMPLPQEYGGVF